MTPCEEWEGPTDKDGYGRMHIAYVYGKSVKMYIHRLIWMQTFGHTDLLICHHCDNPPCINPEHLYAGTAKQNTNDMVERGRHRNNRKTHCSHGHEYTAENIYAYQNSRQCRECRKLIMIKIRQRTKA